MTYCKPGKILSNKILMQQIFVAAIIDNFFDEISELYKLICTYS